MLTMRKKDSILKAAARLFADQGFDGTTTQQIAAEAGVTEPLIYYHYKGKDDLFTRILESTFSIYRRRLESLEFDSDSQFQNIRNLILLHFEFIEDMAEEAYLIVSTCPSRLHDPDDVCVSIYAQQKNSLFDYLVHCLDTGIDRGEFHNVPVMETANLIVAMINGLIRQRTLGLDHIRDMRTTTVEFCRRSLLKEEPVPEAEHQDS